MMRRAFTLIELMFVIAIMAFMGTVAVGGYRAMQRGMDERGTMENVNAFVRAAYQRAQIDRLPTVVYFWNETVASETVSNNTLRVVGKAVAVRRGGRVTDVLSSGKYLVDEFADLNYTYDADDDDGSSGGSRGGANDTMYLYPMDNVNDLTGSTIRRSAVQNMVYSQPLDVQYLSSRDGLLPKDKDFNSGTTGDGIGGTTGDGAIETYAFCVEDAGGVQWKRGMAYGFEFAQLQLPVGFMFGNEYSTTTANPIKGAGSLVFVPGLNQGRGTSKGVQGSRTTVTVYSLRPNENGMLAPEKVDVSLDPSKNLH